MGQYGISCGFSKKFRGKSWECPGTYPKIPFNFEELLITAFSANFSNEMKEISRDKIEELSWQKLEGKSYSEIRAELGASGMAAEEISHTIRQVDELVLKAETEMKHQGKARQWHRSGLVLAVAGLLISILYNANYILAAFPAWLVYAPFFIGILLMFYGRMQQRKQPEIYTKGPGRIRRKRPYK